MGLDGYRIVVEAEERFGITIRDEEAQGVRTVGDLLALINSRMLAQAEASCPSLAAFLRIRRLVRSVTERPSLHIRPSTFIASVVPANCRKVLWVELSAIFESPAPPLRRPRPLRMLLATISCVVVGLGLCTALIDVTILPLGLLMSAAIVITLQLVTSPLRFEPPKTMRTFGDVARRVVGLSSATRPALSPEEVLGVVQTIVSDTLGVDADEVVPEARFIEDLGMA